MRSKMMAHKLIGMLYRSFLCTSARCRGHAEREWADGGCICRRPAKELHRAPMGSRIGEIPQGVRASGERACASLREMYSFQHTPAQSPAPRSRKVQNERKHAPQNEEGDETEEHEACQKPGPASIRGCVGVVWSVTGLLLQTLVNSFLFILALLGPPFLH